MARSSKLDKEIEKHYYAHCAGTSINIMDIPKLYREARQAHANGGDLEMAVIAGIRRYEVTA